MLYSLRNVTAGYLLGGGQSGSNAHFVAALVDLTLEIKENEYLTIVGPNGSGKTTLARLLAGLVDPVSGEFYFRNQKVESQGREMFDDVALVLQEPQCQLLMPTGREELMFTLRNRGLGAKAAATKIDALAEMLGLDAILDVPVDNLSGGEVAILAFACAVITDPETIIIDELDSHLDARMKAIVGQYLEQLRGRKTIIMVTQYPSSEWGSERVVVMKDGRLLEERDGSVPGDEVGLEPINDTAAPLVLPSVSSAAIRPAFRTAIEVVDVDFSYGQKRVLRGVSISIKEGERVGLIGPSGSGKTTLGMIMAGMLRPQAGRVLLWGCPIEQYSRKDLRQNITMALQFPERALIEDTVAADVAVGPANLGYTEAASLVQRQLREFGIEELADRHPFLLSGGQKRKVALAGIMAMSSRILILDEPSAGLDPQSVQWLARLLVNLAGVAYVVISHDADFIRATCERIVVLDGGSVVEEHRVCGRTVHRLGRSCAKGPVKGLSDR